MTNASPKATRGAASLDHDGAVVRDPGEVERLGASGELARLGEPERARAAQVDVEAVERRRHADVERLAESAQVAGEGAGRRNRAGHRGREQRAGVDRDNVVRARPHEADLVRRAMRKAGVKGRPAPARAMRVDQRTDLGVDPGARERLDDEPALPSR